MAVVLATMASSGAAVAAEDPPPPESACTATGYAPNKIVLGATSVTKTFSVKAADCTLDKWQVIVVPFFDVDENTQEVKGVAGNISEGDFKLTPTISLSPRVLKNKIAGRTSDLGIVAAWGVGEDVNVVQPKVAVMPLTLQRRATFGSSFNAPGSVTKGEKITLTGKLVRVNWNGVKKLKYIGWAGKVQVQFKAAGASKYVTVKTVKASSKGKVSTTVKATKTGRWRLYFPGVKSTAPATSGSDAVKVN
ncbi:MAG TPA: hypothetical protein VLL08_32870 [Kineosporiaceae bacterium]|nr:hypothetical protein [Kineosporiaceae bacterium]